MASKNPLTSLVGRYVRCVSPIGRWIEGTIVKVTSCNLELRVLFPLDEIGSLMEDLVIVFPRDQVARVVAF